MFAWFWAVLYMHISMSNVTLSVLCYCTRACVITFLPVFPWRVTIIPKVQPAADNSTDEDNTLLYLQNSSYPTQPQSKHVIANYYSFKIFLHFWLAKTTHIIHHNQLLLTKYWTYDIKSAARCNLLKQWRQKYSLLQIMEPLSEKTWGRGCVIVNFGGGKNKEQNGKTPLRTGKYFEWIIKQLLNSAFVRYEELCRSRRVLSTSAFGLCG